MRLCVIGNSHVAALRAARGAGRAWEGHVVDFYAFPGGRRQPLVEIVAGRLRPIEPPQGILTSVPDATGGLFLDDYDAFLISACGLFAARNGHVVPFPERHPCSAVGCVGWLGDRARPARVQLVSAAVFAATVDAYVRNHASAHLASVVADAVGGPILLQPWPAPSRSLKNEADWFVNEWFEPGTAAWHAFFAAQHAALSALAGDLGPRVSLLDYPLAEMAVDGFMDQRWCDPDPWHANAAYGALVLDQIVGALR